jgi:hypothetical protein
VWRKTESSKCLGVWLFDVLEHEGVIAQFPDKIRKIMNLFKIKV